jgi:integrase
MLPGERIYRSLQTKDAERAVLRAGAVNTLFERGDLDVVARFASGELAITELERAVREGDFGKLRRLHRDGIALASTAAAYLVRAKATLGKATAERYRQIIGAAIAHFGKDRRMHEVSTAEAEAFLHRPRRGGEPWAAHTQAAYRNCLGALWKFAIERDEEAAEAAGATAGLTINPWRRAKAPKLRKTRFSYLSPAEARALLSHPKVAGTPLAALVALGVYAGLRLGELAHLRTDLDVVLADDPKASWIIVQSRDGEHAWRPKTDRGERRLRTVPTLRETLIAHRDAGYAGERYFLRPESSDAPPNSSTLIRWTQAAFAAAGIKYGRRGEALTLHSLRHTYITWLLAAKIPLTTVAKRAGDSPQVILATYAHCMPESDEEADRVLQEIAEGEGATP